MKKFSTAYKPAVTDYMKIARSMPGVKARFNPVKHPAVETPAIFENF